MAATTTTAAAAPSEVTDGPVLSLINKRLRGLRKKYNRIVQMEESISQGKPINKEQEEFLRSKPSVLASIEELEKLRLPLSSALSEEISLAIQENQNQNQNPNQNQPSSPAVSDSSVVEDLLNLLYFGSLFDVKSDFAATMFTREHERRCCLSYDLVLDEATDILRENDLDLISAVGGLIISRPVDSGLSHKNALQRCIEHAKLWLANSNQPIDSNADISYAGLREKLNKIMMSDYFTITPEMKAPVEVAKAAAAAGNYASFQVPNSVPVQVEGSGVQYQQKDEDATNFHVHETGDNQSSPPKELQKDELETANFADDVSGQHEQATSPAEEHHQREIESKEQHHAFRRNYPNQRGGRGGGGGRRGYSNGRGGRGGGRGGGGYQNGRNYYYDQYPRNYYNNRGRGRGGGHPSSNHGLAVQGGHTPADVGVAS